MPTRKITMTVTLSVEDDATVPTFGIAVEGLPETEEGDDPTPEELMTDKVGDAIAAVVKQHNEAMFRNTLPGVRK